LTDYLGDLSDSADMPAGEGRSRESQVTIIVCSSCRSQEGPEGEPRPGLLLAQATREAARNSGVQVRHVACLGNCKRGLSAAMLREGCWSYVFGGLEPAHAADLIVGAELFAGSQDGFMPFRARPEVLKRGLIARVPTLESLKEIP
jgi:predicted metal-binding protein